MGVDDDGRKYVEKWGTGNKKLCNCLASFATSL
jgi:hypothetical protein